MTGKQPVWDGTGAKPRPAAPPPEFADDAAIVEDQDGNVLPPDGDGYATLPVDEPVADEPGIDPTEHTVQEVLDYLAEHPDQWGAVLAVETGPDGKNRSTLTGAAPTTEE